MASDILGGTVASDGEPVRSGTFTTGQVERLHEWRSGFVDGRHDDPTVPVDQWVAPLLLDGVPIGTIAAALGDNGSISLEYLDDDDAASRRLLEEVDGDLVQDPQIGGLVAIESEGVVEPLSDAADEIGRSDDLEELREAVVQAQEVLPASGAEPVDGSALGTGTNSVPAIALAVGAVALVAAGAALWRRPAERSATHSEHAVDSGSDD